VHAHVATLALDVVRLANEIGASLDNISGTTLRMAREEQARQHTAEREAHQQELEHNW